MKNKNTPRSTVNGLVALALLASGGLLYAGPLTPPAGPVAPTGKTLTEVEPRIAINATNTPGDSDSLFKITQPGSYYLTGNITGVIGKHGIEIAASGVTLDLMGFDLAGVPAMGGFDGVSVTVASLTNIAVVNGSVRNWGDDGIDLSTVPATGGRVEGVIAGGNTGIGILAGFGTTVANCASSNNNSSGIVTRDGCTVTNCTAYDNGGIGITAGNGCTITDCSAVTNTSVGIGAGDGSTVMNCSSRSNTNTGISVSGGCTVQGCTSRSNTADGISCSSSCLIRDNACSSNGSGGDGAGIHATGADNRIEANNCIGADRGIDVDVAGSTIIRNTCSGNTTNWDVVAGNVILVVTGSAAGAVVGDSGGSNPGSDNPFANFTY